MGGFINNIYLLVYSRSIENNYKVLYKAYNIYLKQAKIYRVIFALKKYKLVYLIRSLKRFNIEVSLDFNEVKIDFSLSIRVLGLYIDTKLQQGLYITQLIARAVGQKQILKYLVGSIQGAIFAKYRIVYNIVIRLILIFIAPIQYYPRGIEGFSQKPAKRLAKIQNKYLRKVTRVYRVTPIPVLEAEVLVAPLEY